MEIFTAFTKRNDGNIGKRENLKKFLTKNNLENKIPIIMDQKHTNKVCVVDENYKYQICDALVTQRTDVALFTRVADCQPILIWDGVAGVIAAIHAGREGVYTNIFEKTLNLMNEKFKTLSENIHVIIGPSAKKCCYEVAAESSFHTDFVSENFGDEFVHGKNIDLNGITLKQLLNEGIRSENIDISNICTVCNPEKYFSYRRGDKKINFAGVISII
tara:strand:+ start:556 stop:1206 length:651 start_codon:yes stop_codon:yes gene_type:complete